MVEERYLPGITVDHFLVIKDLSKLNSDLLCIIKLSIGIVYNDISVCWKLYTSKEDIDTTEMILTIVLFLFTNKNKYLFFYREKVFRKVYL